jgi:3-deoxy-D-manno-octulosonate 8-phosphate phosphatase (KDO 8-P phosphatase)
MTGAERPDPKLVEIAQHIEGIVLDVDGVLTDGRIIYSDDGRELKQFHVQDGASIKLLAEHGIAVAIITGRMSTVVDRRARELNVEFVVQGAANKKEALQRLVEQGFPEGHLCAVGDDIQDLPLFGETAVTLAVTVPNAHPAVLERAHYVTARGGGEGVVVELAELILRAQDKWPFGQTR